MAMTKAPSTSSSVGNRVGVIQTGVILVAAYLAGVAISPYILPIDFLSSKLTQLYPHEDASIIKESASQPTTLPGYPPTWSPHEAAYKSIVDFDCHDGKDPFYQVDIVIHRNGESDPCSRQKPDTAEVSASGEIDGSVLSSTSRALLQSINTLHNGEKHLNQYHKYDFDAMLTNALVGGMMGGSGEQQSPLLMDNNANSCGPTWTSKQHYLDASTYFQTTDSNNISSMIKFCDMGVDKTPIQLDHDKLVRIPGAQSLPCHFHTREGVRVSSVGQLAQLARGAMIPTGECKENNDRNVDGSCGSGDAGASNEGRRELHLYAVQAGRVFVFAPKYVGEIFELPHVEVPQGLPVWLEVISLSPRVFDIFNFFDREESAAIVDKALKETSETHKIKRSSTGASGYTVNSQRTSENGFDTHGTQAQAVKRRCLNVLGFDEYEESLTDGLQVLRYNKTTAYIPHLDWIDDYQKQNEHNFDTEHLGSNRFATILLYMTDLQEGDGGETVFTHGWPPGQAEEDHIQFDDALNALRESGDVEGLLNRDSWEEKMVANCRSRLSIRPHSSRAVLFYSQNPDGTPDQNSLHGGCPVIKGEKWAANLWVWNAPRNGYPGSPVNQDVVDRNRAAGKSSQNDPQQKQASFTNTRSDESMKNAELYFQDTFWGKLGFGDPPLAVNTYQGHEWNVKVGEVTVRTFVIDDKLKQSYTI